MTMIQKIFSSLFSGQLDQWLACLLCGGIFLFRLIQAISAVWKEIRSPLEEPFASWDSTPLSSLSDRDFHVRFANWRDNRELRAINSQCFPTGLLSDDEETEQEESPSVTLVAVLHQHVVGYAVLSARQDRISIELLVVSPGCRLRVVTPFLACIRDWLLKNQIADVCALCREKTAYRLLKKHGKRLGISICEAKRQEEPQLGEYFYSLRLQLHSPNDVSILIETPL